MAGIVKHGSLKKTGEYTVQFAMLVVETASIAIRSARTWDVVKSTARKEASFAPNEPASEGIVLNQ